MPPLSRKCRPTAVSPTSSQAPYITGSADDENVDGLVLDISFIPGTFFDSSVPSRTWFGYFGHRRFIDERYSLKFDGLFWSG